MAMADSEAMGISDGPHLPPLFEPGLVWTCWQTGNGIVMAEATPPAGAAFRWLHLDLWDQRSARWIAQNAGCPAAIQTLFLSSDEQPQVLAEGDAVAMILPDFQREFDRDATERIGALHLVLRPGLMLTGRHHPLHTPDIFRHRAAQAGRLDEAGALAVILDALVDTVGTRTTAILSELLALEDQILANEQAPDTRALVALRRLTARLHRMAAGLSTTLGKALLQPAIASACRAPIETALQRLQPIERDVAAAQTQLRLLREELDLQAGQQTNENVYLLSVITALIMPATLVTGFFGMNTGGMPLEHGASGTLLATIVAVACSLATWLLLRMMGLIRR